MTLQTGSLLWDARGRHRIPVPWVFMLGYLIGAGLEVLFLPGHPLRLPHYIGVGRALFAAGAVIAGWAWMIFHLKGNTKTPGESSAVLVTSGPYSLTRNPMYLGLTIAYIGFDVNKAQIVPLITLLLVLAYVNWIVIPIEEERLHEVFGPVYDSYRLRVHRWLGFRSRSARHVS